MLLWNSEYPRQLAYATVADLDRYLDGLDEPSHILLADGGTIKVWAFGFMRGGARWVAIIVSRGAQRQGHGTSRLDLRKAREPVLNGWVIDHGNDVRLVGTPYP